MDALVEQFLFEHAWSHRGPHFKEHRSTVLDRLLDGMTEEQLRLRPAPGLNSIIWPVWHNARCEDVGMTALAAGERQVLDAGDWSPRLGLDRRDIATGMTDGEVTELSERINIPALLEYLDAVASRTRQIVRRVAPHQWAEMPDQAWLGRMISEGAFGPNAQGVIEYWTGKPRWFFLRLGTLHSYGHLFEATTVKTLVTVRATSRAR